jgi:16S rRNA (adenine1518-N6/adenine1519-N6)-dimethyltransferase
MNQVKPKKSLGQHFLRNSEICERVAASVDCHGGYKHALEIGPGMGALTQFLLKRTEFTTTVVEIDSESVVYLNKNYPELTGRILEEDFLHMNLPALFNEQTFAVVGNFPYNISSQILFKVLENKEYVPEVVGMFQKEVAVRIASGPGNKDYGILSVLAQAYYDIEYLFTVEAEEFIPPPKVKSGVIRLKRKFDHELGCSEKALRMVVKTAFNQRRKTLRNSIKSLNNHNVDLGLPIFEKRPEQLGVEDFVYLTHYLKTPQ